MPNIVDGAGEALRDYLRKLVFPLSASHEHELKELVCDYVDELKGLGWSPEHVIVVIKTVVREAELEAFQGVRISDTFLASREQLHTDIVGWCIERYYASQPD